MTYVLTDNLDNIIKFPYTKKELIRDNPDTSFPDPIPDLTASFFNVWPVTLLDRPEINPAIEALQVNDLPVKNQDSWELGWTVIPLSIDEQNERQRQYINSSYLQTVKTINSVNRDAADEGIASVLAFIYAEVKAYQVDNTVSTPVLQSIATEWGVTRGEALTRIINKYSSFLTDFGIAFAIREDSLDGI